MENAMASAFAVAAETSSLRLGNVSLLVDSAATGVTGISIELDTVSWTREAPELGTFLPFCELVSTAVHAASEASTTTVVRSFLCQPGRFHNVSDAAATATDTFTKSVDGTLQWDSVVVSNQSEPWSTPIAAAVKYSNWDDNTSTIWLGGPRSGQAPRAGVYDPFAPFSLGEIQPSAAAADAQEKADSPGDSQWYIAQDYDATYDCLTGPCSLLAPKGSHVANYEACQSLCEAHPNCTIFAFSDKSSDCWQRTDGQWGQPSTLHPYPATSGCRKGTDPTTGNPWVNGCGPVTSSVTKFWYGGNWNDIGNESPRTVDGASSTLPILSRIDSSDSSSTSSSSQEPPLGLSLIMSPDNTPIVAFATATRESGTNNVWLNWTRQYHRLGNDSAPVQFRQHIVAHGPGWRPAAGFLRNRYPAYFLPNASTVTTLSKIQGTASYADLRGPVDLDPHAVATYAKNLWRFNWDSTARFPWHGEWAPTAADGFDVDGNWTTCFAHAAPDAHTGEPCTNVSYADLAAWYSTIREAGAFSCAYGNLFEFGWNVEQSWQKDINCSEAAIASKNETALLCHSQRLLQTRYGGALIHDVKDPNKLVCGGLDGSCIMDPHPTLPYLPHVLEMAQSSMLYSPSSGVCIDRQDWIGVVNPTADDGRTWLPTGDPSNPFQRVRAMIFSWKLAMEAFAAEWHAQGQVVIINDHSNRLDMMRYCDGIYAEMGDMQTTATTTTSDLNTGRRTSEQVVEGSINAHAIGTALASLGPRVAFIWNHPKTNISSEYIAAGLAAHLWAGVFPTSPVKNNDHAIGGDCAPDCSYSDAFAEFAPLFSAIRRREWVLNSAQAVTVLQGNALANVFRESPMLPANASSSSSGANSTHIIVPVIQIPFGVTVSILLRGLQFSECPHQQQKAAAAAAAAPIRTTNLSAEFVFPASTDGHGSLRSFRACDESIDGIWVAKGAWCAQLDLSVTRQKSQALSGGAAAAVIKVKCQTY